MNIESQKILHEILTVFKENPKTYYTPKMIHETIQKRTVLYCANALWRLWKKGCLTHSDRRYYQWNKNQKKP